MYKDFNLKIIEPCELVDTARTLKEEGYRMVQICATKIPDAYEITYSFDKDYEMVHYRITIPEDMEIMSITDSYFAAFVYENEMKDLFGIKIKHIALDFQGEFFVTNEPTPWKDKEERKDGK
jgi:ech hydrogenase subunit D